MYARYEEENLYGWRRAGDINEDNSQVGVSDIGKGQKRGVNTGNSRDGTSNAKTHQAGNLNAGNSQAGVNNVNIAHNYAMSKNNAGNVTPENSLGEYYIADTGRSDNINSGHSRAGEVNEALVENAMNFNAGASQVELKNSQESEMKAAISQNRHGNFGDRKEGYQETLEEHRSDLLNFLTG